MDARSPDAASGHEKKPGYDMTVPIRDRFRYIVVPLRGAVMWFNKSKSFGWGVEDRRERRLVREGLTRENARAIVRELNDV